MQITQLCLTNFRCFDEYQLEFEPGINLIVGENASGKSSVIEAANLLGRGQSFRAKTYRSIIRKGVDQSQVTARALYEKNNDPQKIALGYQLEPKSIYHRVAGQTITRRIQLLDAVPVHLIGPDATLLVAGSPAIRRQFLDWGMFHVKHESRQTWINSRRLLKQRNAALRNEADDRLLQSFDDQLIPLAESLSQYRLDYFNHLKAKLMPLLAELLESSKISIRLDRGWKQSAELSDLFLIARDIDRKRKLTTQGPQRADLVLTTDGKVLTQTLSRGQQKAVAIAMLLAQHQLITEHSQHNPVLLVDDLFAELDALHSQKALDLIQSQSEQALVTIINPDSIAKRAELKMFHVKH